MRSRVLTLLVLIAALLASLTTTSPAVSAGGDPDFHRPTVGDCYDYGFTGLAAISAPDKTVPCDQSHREQIIAVPRVDKIDIKNPDGTFDKIGVRCYRALYKRLGGTQETRALTAYNLGYFVPRQDELDKGARWTRCDMVLLGGKKLMPLPDPLLPATPDDSTALCLSPKGLYGTVCARKHTYRATGVVLVDGKTYPGEAKLELIGERKCGSRTTGKNFIWRYPGELVWKAGKHLVTCYSKTKD